MKRLGVVTFPAILLAVLVSGTASASADRSSPVAVVKSFYAWYMKHDWADNVAMTKPYFTPALYTRVAAVLRDERCFDEALIDYDPFNGSQVETASYSVGLASVHGVAATVPVRVMLAMGPGGKASPGGPIAVSVVRGASGWRIDNVVAGVGKDRADLVKLLRESLAEVQKELTDPKSPEHPTAAQRACIQKPLP